MLLPAASPTFYITPWSSLQMYSIGVYWVQWNAADSEFIHCSLSPPLYLVNFTFFLVALPSFLELIVYLYMYQILRSYKIKTYLSADSLHIPTTVSG